MEFLGHSWSLGGVSGALLYLVMPVRRPSVRDALVGAVTAIVVLLTLEVGATLLLLGAQVIAEYERLGRTGEPEAKPEPLRTARP